MFLARLYWMTVEFGLVDTPGRPAHLWRRHPFLAEGNALQPVRRTRAPAVRRQLEAMRTPYRIDILQPLYFVLPDLKQLFDLAQQDIMAMVREAMRMGLHQPKFPPKAA